MPMNPSLSKAFSKIPRTRSEASSFGGSHNNKTKQNKLPSFIDRLIPEEIYKKEHTHTKTLISNPQITKTF
jgi:hypothetical protein